MAPAPKYDPKVLPGRFPVWYGLIAAAIVVGLVAAAGASELLPPWLWSATGQLMLIAHFLTVFAIVSLIGELGTLGAWNHALDDFDADASRGTERNPAVKGLNMALSVLRRRHARDELKGAIDATRTVLEHEYSRRWTLCRDLCFVIPLFGCLLSLWNLRFVSNAIPYRDLGTPLVIAIIETVPVLLLAGWLSRAAGTALDRWKLAAEGIAGIEKPQGHLHSSVDVDEDEDEDVVAKPTEKRIEKTVVTKPTNTIGASTTAPPIKKVEPAVAPTPTPTPTPAPVPTPTPTTTRKPDGDEDRNARKVSTDEDYY